MGGIKKHLTKSKISLVNKKLDIDPYLTICPSHSQNSIGLTHLASSILFIFY